MPGTTDALGQAQGALSRETGMQPALEAAIFGANTKEQAARNVQSAAITSGAENLATSTKLAAEQTIHEDDIHKQLLAAVGLDINDPNSQLTTALKTEATSRQKRAEMRPAITELQSKNLFDDPFGYLMAIPQLGKLIPQYNALADAENEAGAQVSEMTTLATNLKNLTPARSADLLRQKAQADANSIKDAAAAQAAQLSAANAAGNAKAMLDAFTTRRNVFADVLNLQQHEESIKQRQLTAENLQFQRGIVNEDRAARLEMKQNAANQETALLTGINLYKKTINGNTAPDFTAEDIKRMPPQLKEAWYGVILRGNYGNTYADSVPFIDQFGNVAGAAQAGNAGMMQQVRNVQQRVQPLEVEIVNKNNATNPMAHMKVGSQESRRLAYDTLYKNDVAVAAPGAIKDSIEPGNPYALDFTGAAKAAAAMKDPGFIGQILVEAQARNPGLPIGNTLTPRNFLSEVNARVVAGTTDPKTAAQELARFIALTSASQYDASGIKYLGLPQLTDFTIRPGPAGTSTVDLMNPTKLEGYFTSQVAADRRAKHSVVGGRTLGFN